MEIIGNQENQLVNGNRNCMILTSWDTNITCIFNYKLPKETLRMDIING